jgi:ribulose-phosphate 3-epimerase
MIEIIPAILPSDLSDLRDKMTSINGQASLVQIDVCDGRFVPSKTWPYCKGGMEEFNKIINEEEDFPFWDSLDLEIDLMVRNPEEVVEGWIRAGAKRLVLHIESAPNIMDTFRKLRTRYGNSNNESFGLELGISLDLRTSNEDIYSLLKELDEEGDPIIDFVQFMGILNVGFQGQELDEQVLEKISDLRNEFPNIHISVDGGVNFDNASDLISAGATRLVSGSTILESGDITQAIYNLSRAGEITLN